MRRGSGGASEGEDLVHGPNSLCLYRSTGAARLDQPESLPTLMSDPGHLSICSAPLSLGV